MKKITSSILTSTTLILSGCYNSPTVLDKPPGHYQSQSTSTDANGTTYNKTTTTDVGLDQYGRKSAVVSTGTSKDPKGLFNKTTDTQTNVVTQE